MIYLIKLVWAIESVAMALPFLFLGGYMIRTALRMPIKTRAALKATKLMGRT